MMGNTRATKIPCHPEGADLICHPEGALATEGSRIANDVHVGRDPSPRVTRFRMTSCDELLDCRKFVLAHERSSRERRRLERLDMATRLVQWLKQTSSNEEPPQSLAVAAEQYYREGSFVDWARLSLRSGDSVGKLSQAYAKLFDFCTTRHEQASKRFAELLSNYTRTNSSDEALIHVEDFLDRVVAPLAAHGRVLLIVMDGMSVAVARELMSDVTSREWVSLVHDGHGSTIGLAAIPSVTEISRASLLSGKLCQGDQNQERREFEQHAGLNEQSRSGYPPVLFHKGALQQSDDTGLSADVRKEIGSSHRKVVGVVVNAIDDHLAKGEQIDTRWTRDEIRGLSALLHEARNAGRTVIFVSDHGHVLDCGTQAKMFDGMERWRNDDGQPTDIELQISGHRVVVPESHKLIAPWSERVRFCNQKKNGYHGGISPQEMVIPIAVLSAGEPFPEGWSEAPVDTPTWWEIQEERPTSAHPEPKLKPPEPVEPPEPPPGMLFPVEPPVEQEEPATVEVVEVGPSAIPIADWIKALLASPVFDSQKQLAGRAAPPAEMFARLLAAVDQRGGKITSPALARAINASPMRLRGMLAVAQRVMNIDGYAVLTKDDASDTVQLDRDLLLKQFDLNGMTTVERLTQRREAQKT